MHSRLTAGAVLPMPIEDIDICIAAQLLKLSQR